MNTTNTSGVAIWFHTNDRRSIVLPIKVEVHFNFWRLKERKSKKNKQFLDVGLMVENPNNINSLHVFLPFAITDHIQDLGKILKSTSTLQAVFNESWRSLVDPEADTFDIVDFETKKLFQVYPIPNTDNMIKSFHGGSIINLSLPDTLKNKTYIRFRIFANRFTPIINEYKPTNAWIESAFYITETIDLHINEKRNLSEDLLKILHTEGYAIFTKTHVFIMRSDSFDHVFSFPIPIDSRSLEPNIWNDYIGPQYFPQKITAYHWRQKMDDTAALISDSNLEKLKSYNVFTKFRFQKANWRTILIFILILLAISIVGSLVIALIQPYL